jgi:glutathione reductase (NADPH)
MSYDFDLFCIGAGSGGVRASRMAAKTGAKVAVCEHDRLGGTCVNVGCVPKKLFVYGSHYRHDLHDAKGYGWTIEGASFDWPTLKDNKDKEIARLNRIYGRLLDDAGVTLITGKGKLCGPHEVEVDGQRYTAKHILVGVGSWPTLPDIPGIEHAVTSNELFAWDALPEKVLVVGGGYIGVELTCILFGLGVQVTQAYRGAMFMRGFDNDVRSFLAEQMRHAGIDLNFECDLERIELTGDGKRRVVFKDHDEVEYDAVLFATGRHPRTEGLGLEAAGVKVDDHGAIIVDEHYQTNVPSIYAIGDVINHMTLTPVALAQGMAVVKTLFEDNPSTVDYDNVATAVFSQPPIGSVGLSEQEARERFGAVDIYKSTFTPMKLTMTERKEKTLMKLVVDRESQKVVGAHMVGPDAGEIIQGVAIALKCGATKQQFDATIGIHPTAAEEFVTMRERLPDPEPPPAH